jgi:hypothetical protein
MPKGSVCCNNGEGFCDAGEFCQVSDRTCRPVGSSGGDDDDDDDFTTTSTRTSTTSSFRPTSIPSYTLSNLPPSPTGPFAGGDDEDDESDGSSGGNSAGNGSGNAGGGNDGGLVSGGDGGTGAASLNTPSLLGALAALLALAL